MRRPKSAAPALPDAANAGPVTPDPDQAWKALSLVNDWVKHAETKLGAILAATGVTGGVLFNLVKDRAHGSAVFNLASAACGVAIFIAGLCAMAGLYPRLRLRRTSTTDAANPLFFHDVANAYRGDAPSYGAVLHTLTTNREDLVRHLGQQIHANATVAQRKFRWADRAIRALLVAVLALGAVAAIIAVKK